MSDWITAPFESAEGNNLVMCTLRTDVDRFRNNPRFKFRVEVEWPYKSMAGGMPPESLGKELEAVADALHSAFKADPVAVLTGIYTGNGCRTMVFYTLSLHIFQRKFNEALAAFPQLPLEFEAYEDPEWEEYDSMLSQVGQADDSTDHMAEGDFDAGDDGDSADGFSE